jgi:hypothetical protein
MTHGFPVRGVTAPVVILLAIIYGIKDSYAAVTSHSVIRTRLLHVSLAAGLLFGPGAASWAAPLQAPALQKLVKQIWRQVYDIPVGKRLSPQQKNFLIPLKELGHDAAVKVVNLRVWQFYRGFRKGADNPDRYLGFMRAKQPRLVDAWLKTPRDKRIFIVGSGKESELADSASRDLQKQGYRTFFFNDCKPILCNDAHVGAMLATADNAYFLNTPLAQKSRFVEVELAAARRHLGYQEKGPIVIPAADLLEDIKKQSAYRMDDRIVCDESYPRKRCWVE